MKRVVYCFAVFFVVSIVALAQDQNYTVTRVIDGDTFKLSNGQNLKLTAVNAPELHDVTKLHQEAKRFGKEIWAYRTIGGKAHEVVERLLKLADDQIKLESGSETFDENGNLLAYVYVLVDQLEEGIVPDDVVCFKKADRYEIFLNAYLVKSGFAEVIDGQDQKHQNILLQLEKEAKANKKGIWGG